MNPAYLMLGLGLTVPEILAIREELPAYRALRLLIAFFVDNGFSLLPVAEPKPLLAFETLYLRMETNANNQVVLQYRPEGNYFTCTFLMHTPYGLSTHGYSLDQKCALTASVRSWKLGSLEAKVHGLGLPYDLALKDYMSMISGKYFTPK